MKSITTIHTDGDSYIFQLADDWSIASIHRYANNQNVEAESKNWDDLDPEIQAEFRARLRTFRGQT